MGGSAQELQKTVKKTSIHDLVLKLVELKGKQVDLKNMRYTPLTQAQEKQVELLNKQIKELDETESNEFSKLINNEIIMEIKDYKLVNKGYLVARFNVVVPEWGGMLIRECSLFCKDNKKWINLPSRSYEDNEGKKKHFDFIIFEKSVKERFQAACLEKISQIVPDPMPPSDDGQQELPF